MFGVRLWYPECVFYNNHGVVNNMIILESVLHMKHNANNYNPVCEAVAADILQIRKDNGETNFAYLLTNVMTGKQLWDLCYHIFSEDWV